MNHKYQIIKIIGEGAYGIVYKCKNIHTGEIVAIKKFLDEYEKLPKKVNREIYALQTSKHHNIVKFIEAFLNKGYLFLVFEYAEKNLIQLIEEKKKGLSPELIRSFTYQMCQAISYLHKKDIIHRDIKPENILIKNNSQILLCDFGFSRKFKKDKNTNNYEKMTEYITTRWYRAPELILGQGNYGPEIDLWSIGCLMGEMADGNPMFPGDCQFNQLECIIKLLGNLPKNLVELYNNNPKFNMNKMLTVDEPETLEKRYKNILSPEALDFMKGLLELDPKKRLNADTVLNHKYFDYFKNVNDKEKNTNNIMLSLDVNEKNKIKIPPFKRNSIKKKSNIINIFTYDDDSFIEDTNESTVSKVKFENKNKKKSIFLKSIIPKRKEKHYRSDMVDFSSLYIKTQKDSNDEKNENKEEKSSEKNNKNYYISQPNLNGRNSEGLNHKKSFFSIKNTSNLPEFLNKNQNENNIPFLSPIFFPKNNSSERKLLKEKNKINYVSLFNYLKIENEQPTLISPRFKKSKRIILFPKNKNESKSSKRKNHSIDFKNGIYNINHLNLENRKSFDISPKLYKIIGDKNNFNSSSKMINLYEKSFKKIISNNNNKNNDNMKVSYSPSRRKSDISRLFKIIEPKNINIKQEFKLPPIFNFHNEIPNNNKKEKISTNLFQYNYKLENKRYN